MNESKYSELIKKIKRRQKWVIALSIVAVLCVLLFTAPMELVIMDETVVLSKGLRPIFTVLLVILCFIVELVAYGTVSSEMTNSMDKECDPEKHMVLNANLNKQKNIDDIYAVDYLFLGDYQQSIFYAEKMVASNQKHHILAGLLHKARSEFMLGDYDALSKTKEEYFACLESQTNMNSKVKAVYQKISDLIILMSAILGDDIENINQLRNAVEPWVQSVGCKGFIDYVKGVAANKVADKQEAIFRFKLVTENCPKTIFSQKANGFLKEME